MLIGQYNLTRVQEEMPQGFYLETEDGDRVLLPGSKAPKDLHEGDELTVFIYIDNEGRPVATLQKPLATVGTFAVLEVKDVNETGAFLDWGLDKDLMLPFKQQLGELRVGDKCVVFILEDKLSGRIVATEKLKSFIDRKPAPEDLHIGQKVELAVYEVTEEYVDFLVNYRYSGRLFTRDLPQGEKFYIGDVGDGFIQNIREDGKIDLSLTPVGYRATMQNSDSVMEKLEEAGGFLPLGDDADPAAIREKFGLSKKAYKKIIGGLFRKGLIDITGNGIRKRDPQNRRR
jgi:predicted RNA-binding protein (virulence factor B family)